MGINMGTLQLIRSFYLNIYCFRVLVHSGISRKVKQIELNILQYEHWLFINISNQ